MPKFANINYSQVVEIREFESLEDIYANYYSKEIVWVEAGPEILVGWGYDETTKQFIQPSADGFTYCVDGDHWMLLPDGLTQDQIIDDIRNSRIKQNQDIVDYSIDQYTLELVGKGVLQ